MQEHRQQTERNLVIAGFAAMFVIGGVVVWWQLGLGAAAATWACLGSGVALVGLLYAILKLAEMWVNRR